MKTGLLVVPILILGQVAGAVCARGQEVVETVIDPFDVDQLFPPIGWRAESLGTPGFPWFTSETGFIECAMDSPDEPFAHERLISPIYDFSIYDRVNLSMFIDFEDGRRFSSDDPPDVAVFSLIYWNLDDGWRPIIAYSDDEFRDITVAVPPDRLGRVGFDLLYAGTRTASVQLSAISIVGFNIGTGPREAPEPLIHVLSPGPSTVWRPGQTVGVHWVGDPVVGSGPRIELWRKVADLGFGFAPDGEQVALVPLPPDVPAGDNYRIRVASTWLEGAFGESQGFLTIDPNAQAATRPESWELYE